MNELLHLFAQLGLGAAAQDVCDLLTELAGETMTLHQFEQEIRNVLRLHHAEHCTEAVLGALGEIGFTTVAEGGSDNERAAEALKPGHSPVCDSSVFATGCSAIVAEPRTSEEYHPTAVGWLDIDGGIHVDVRQHGAEPESGR